ncbi:MAG: hypothetical protein NTY35_04380 [Planctomycetota bacterium]|nr:hypothetical protein [Planctomycetota bacterium]
MRSTLRSAAFVVALALLALPAGAATLKLKNGTTVTGKVSRYDATAKTLYVTTDAGKDEQYRIDQLDARSSYLVNASLVPPDDAGKQLQVANFARDAGLYSHAVRRYGIAAKLDPTLKATVDTEMTKLKRMAAEECMKNARAAVAKGDFADAEKWLTVLIEKLPDEPEAKEAAAALENHYAKTRSEKMAAADKKASDALKRDIEKGKKQYAEMVDKTKKGLQARGDSLAKGLFNGALTDGKAVMGLIDDLEKKYDDPQTRESTASYRTVVIGQMVEVHLHMASLETVKSDYRGALKEVNAALALDPKNASALAARARIEEASSQGWWRW